MNQANKERYFRYIKAYEILQGYNVDESDINSLIKANKSVFKDFKIIFATNKYKSIVGHHDLLAIESKHPFIKSFFSGSGLFFYSKDIYKDMENYDGRFVIADYSLSFDTNIANQIRVWEKGGNLDKNKMNIESLIHYIKDKKINYDYLFYILEDFKHSKKKDNNRTFETLCALKRLDFYQKSTKIITPPRNDDFKISKENVSKQMLGFLSQFFYENQRNNFGKKRFSNVFELYFSQRKILYLLLIKTVYLLNFSKSLEYNLHQLIEYSLEKLGKFLKSELYFCWKILKYRRDFCITIHYSSKQLQISF